MEYDESDVGHGVTVTAYMDKSNAQFLGTSAQWETGDVVIGIRRNSVTTPLYR